MTERCKKLEHKLDKRSSYKTFPFNLTSKQSPKRTLNHFSRKVKRKKSSNLFTQPNSREYHVGVKKGYNSCACTPVTIPLLADGKISYDSTAHMLLLSSKPQMPSADQSPNDRQKQTYECLQADYTYQE